ncbi:MAG TPA: flagellar hook assembly protein FlgD [Acetobacteraceae bacterium]|nr:flagellar hook assembly protein FlgD [Acetobacteraceae bacterium]
MSLASVAAQQNSTAQNATAAANAAASGNSSTGSTTGTATGTSGDALSSLSGNFSSFLSLLMTQLQNQDPTSPLDTNQFTSQLVQFAGVEQQINANTSLTQLIQLTQGSELMQASAMMGRQVAVQSDHMPLQNGSGALAFTAPAAEPAAIAIYNDAGSKIRDALVNATKGQNAWTWDGTDNNGDSVPDGSYRVAVIGANTDGTTAALPFNVLGVATGVQKSGNAVQLQLGALTTDFTTVQSVAGTSAGGQ